MKVQMSYGCLPGVGIKLASAKGCFDQSFYLIAKAHLGKISSCASLCPPPPPPQKKKVGKTEIGQIRLIQILGLFCMGYTCLTAESHKSDLL